MGSGHARRHRQRPGATITKPGLSIGGGLASGSVNPKFFAIILHPNFKRGGAPAPREILVPEVMTWPVGGVVRMSSTVFASMSRIGPAIPA